MGNLVLLLFWCGNYFRYKHVELVTDSHFGHYVPVSFLSLWNIKCTSSALPSRKGISNLQEISGEKLSDEDREKLADEKSENETNIVKFDQLEPDEEEKAEDDSARIYGEAKKKKIKKSKVKTRLDYFRNKLVQQSKGTFHVQMTSVQLTEACSTNLYLHAVNDSKVVFRLSNYYAAKPKVRMNFTLQEE